MMDSRKIISNLIWRFCERIGAQGVSMIVSIVLARLLAPSVYGTVALITVFTTLLQVFVDSGLGSALVQKKDADDLDFSTVFYFNLLMCSVLYLVMFFAAPFIAAFYESPELTPVIRVVSLILIISGVRNVQQSYVSKQMAFKRFFYATISGTIVSGVVGIAMAYGGYGVWALVAQMLVNLAVGTVVLWFTVKWRPKFMFSFSRLKKLFSYGWKLLVSSLINTAYNDLRKMIIGKVYTKDDLAFYERGSQFPSVAVTNINASIDSVLFPAMSASQDDKNAVKTMTRRAIKTSTYILFPVMIGLGVCAKPIVSLVLTDKWLPCVPFMYIYCFTYAFQPIHTANLNAIKAIGRSDMFLKLEIIKKILGLAVILITIPYGVMTMAYGMIITSVASQIINSWPNKKLLDYSYLEQLKDMLPSMGLSILMGVIVSLVGLLGLGNILTLVIQVVLGVGIYLGGSILFRLECFEYVIGLIKKFLHKR
ncbi:MAG: lipopolysaccharide biosynthesis protein [Ruminococcaceae bacterium]|nr:lipopolysaccharide biosynthesis protein [Oscillospiraceae bacterium]